VFLSFKLRKYLIKTREFFDENVELNHAMLRSEMGYEDWPKKNMTKIRHFLDDDDFSRFINAWLIDNKHLKINSNIGLIKGIGERRKTIYYTIDVDKNPNKIVYLHRIIYK
jgi:hypothetical protein